MLRPPTPLESMMLTGCGRSGGGAAFVGALDALAASVEFAISVRRLLTSYIGPAGEMRGNGTGSPTATINHTAQGNLDQAAVAALAATGGGTQAFWTTLYEQSGNARHVVQASGASQPAYGAGSNGRGALVFDGADDYMDSPSFAVAQPYFILTVSVLNTVSRFQYFCGTIGSTPTFMGQYNGGVYAGSVLSLWAGLRIDGVWNTPRAFYNGASSDASIDGTAPTVGAAGSTGINGGWRIGNRFDLALPMAGSIAEQIIFNTDPRVLPGWAAFIANVEDYYGL